MSIQRKPKVAGAKAEVLISNTPNAVVTARESYDKGIRKGNKRQISLTIAPELLRKVDELAMRTGQARAAVITMAIYRALEGDVFAR